VDYSNFPITTVELPWADQTSWSPDGTMLAYTACDLCAESSECNASYYLLPMSSGAMPTLMAQHQTFKERPVLTAWLDSQRVLYQYGEPADVPLDLAWYDVAAKQATSSHLEVGSGFTAMLVLQHEQAQLLIGRRDQAQEIVILRFTNDLEIVETLPATSLSYNRRFPRYLFLGLSNNVTQVLDAELNISVLDLSTFLPDDRSEELIYLAPGVPVDGRE
jgi:hypothetical protein